MIYEDRIFDVFYADTQLCDDIFSEIHTVGQLRHNLRFVMRFFRMCLDELDQIIQEQQQQQQQQQPVFSCSLNESIFGNIQETYVILAKINDTLTGVPGYEPCVSPLKEKFFQIVYTGMKKVNVVQMSTTAYCPPDYRIEIS